MIKKAQIIWKQTTTHIFRALIYISYNGIAVLRPSGLENASGNGGCSLAQKLKALDYFPLTYLCGQQGTLLLEPLKGLTNMPKIAR